MSSQRKIEASRRNASKSTGPMTREGKAVVARNANKHGLRSPDVHEATPARQKAFALFKEALREELKPIGVMQGIVFDQIANLGWKLKSAARIERSMVRVARRERIEQKEIGEKHERGALTRAGLIAQAFQETDNVGVNVGDRNPFATLRRYEASIERSFYRACAELRKLQAEARQRFLEDDGNVEPYLAEQSQTREPPNDPSREAGVGWATPPEEIADRERREPQTGAGEQLEGQPTDLGAGSLPNSHAQPVFVTSVTIDSKR